MDDDGELREQILHIEAHIEDLPDVIEGCRKIIVISKVAIAVGGTPRGGQVRSYGHDWCACGCYRRHSRFWVKHKYFEANCDRGGYAPA
jgi:hypothetical protein